MNNSFYISPFKNYSYFESKYKSAWIGSTYYYIGDIVKFGEYYWERIVFDGVSESDPSQSGIWQVYSTFGSGGELLINGENVGSSSGYNNKGSFYFKGGTSKPRTRVIFPSENSDQIKVGNWLQTVNGYSLIETISNYTDVEIYDDTTGLPIGFKDYSKYLVATISDQYDSVYFSFDSFVNVYSKANCKTGVFTFFDFKDFDFDFWSSTYGITPNYEAHRYLELLPDTENVIQPNVLYIVKQGQITYNSSQFSQGSAFFGVSGKTSFSFVNQFSSRPVVFPFQFSENAYGGTSGYSNIGYEDDLDSFQGFLGISSVESVTPPGQNLTKLQSFNYGLLESEYDYLRENYNVSKANLSRIVPFINKWGYKNGTDSRGNPYRLNSSPAFSPSNFSPTFQNFSPDPKYLTHEWFLLESVPREFPKEFIKDQQSYLAGKIDLNKATSTQDEDLLYLAKYFTIDPEDYNSLVRDVKDEVKELFSEFSFNEENGYYETLFRGVKISLKKRSDSSSANRQTGFSKYVKDYRGYDGYRYSCLLRCITETTDTIQSPVTYRVIENSAQKFIVFLIDVVVNDYKAQALGYTGSTGGSPQLDYTLLYTLSNKQKLGVLTTASLPYSTADIKLSSALDLSVASSSVVNTSTDPGIIYILPNPNYDTDLREEVNLFYSKTAALSTFPGISGPGSFYVSQISSTYPWPVGSSENSVDFAPINYGANYSFNIPFSFGSPVTVPVGPRTIYKDKPVFQKSGGEDYFDFILNRTSFSYVADRINTSNQYVNYETYYTDGTSSFSRVDGFELYFETPTYFIKPGDSRPVKIYSSAAASAVPGVTKTGGPATQTSGVVNSYQISYNPRGVRSDLLRYSGKYEPLFTKIIHFGKDKTDEILSYSGDFSFDVSFRNCTFSPQTYNFGIIKNLSYTKVSDNNILSPSEKLPEGPRYPLISQTPIAKKDFNVFQSNWDPGYYNKYETSSSEDPVAGTKAVREFKSFLGSKIMKTPKNVLINNCITVPLYKDQGTTDVDAVNDFIDSNIVSIQSVTASNSGLGIGAAPIFRTSIDLSSFSQNIFPKAEIFWQKTTNSRINGVIRADRMLRRYLMNDGVGEVFFNNIISEFGVGDPASIQDDILDYLGINVDPVFEISNVNLFVKKTGSQTVKDIEIVRGDIYSGDRSRLGYVSNPNFILTKDSNLVYGFQFDFDPNFEYSLIFRIAIDKI